jgi:dTDP-4-dehydrorhamnose reductase
MIKVLVTGAGGQLGQCIRDAASNFPDCDLFFATRKDLNIENKTAVLNFFSKHAFDYCINAAAYTNVEKAESESDAAFSANAEAVKYLSEACTTHNTLLIQISTDYVFDGEKGKPYEETDETNPLNVYGASKLKGEQYVQDICDKYFIFRTSWLYSQYGHNFLNTILRLAREKKPMTITTEQTGTPTNANDLANMILKVIDSTSSKYGLYHFSNEGEATWYDFAKAILESTQQIETTSLAKTDHYRTFAARPKYSVLNKAKFSNTFSISLRFWEESLKELISLKKFK